VNPPFQFQQSICNEIYEKWPLRDACRSMRRIGYTGIEISPFTLAEYPGDVTPAQRREYRDIIHSEDLRFVGLHWLMVSPKGLHVTTPDPGLRERSWRHIIELIDLCGDLGENGVMVFGSPKQRCTVDGLTPAEAARNFTTGLAAVAPHAAQRGVTVLVEALPLNQCDVITTLAEAVAIVKQVDNPAVRTMFDTHNAVDESEPHAALVDRYFDLIRHVHINETDGRHPGTGSYDFKPILAVLRRRAYAHWVSLEAFDFTPGPEKIANDSLRFIEKEIEQLAL
jgi:D-psicose/D-tagatose/L-ribulose 3-epimerase